MAGARAPLGEPPPIPERRGSPERQARRNDVWRSVITQQLQADELAVEMSSQLFSAAPDHEAKLYYSTMVQDEARHTEAWLKLIEEAGGQAERDPYLDELGRCSSRPRHARGEGLPMQVFYERLIIPQLPADRARSPGTVLEDLCNRLTIDDGIHHSAGMAYERILLEQRRQEDAGPADRRGQRDAAAVREARALAAARARVDRQRDAGPRRGAAEG